MPSVVLIGQCNEFNGGLSTQSSAHALGSYSILAIVLLLNVSRGWLFFPNRAVLDRFDAWHCSHAPRDCGERKIRFVCFGHGIRCLRGSRRRNVLLLRS